jgi:hypothetical protein
MFFPPERPYSSVKPFFGLDETFNAVFTNPGLLHVTLATLAKTLSLLTNAKFGPDAVYHHSQAITIVNKSIANFRHEPTLQKDNTISTVCALAYIEVRTLSTSTFILIANIATLLDEI